MFGRSDLAPVCPVNPEIREYISVSVYVTLLVFFLCFWHWKTTGYMSASTVATFAAFSVTAQIYGGVVLPLSPLSPKLAGTLTLQFLFGFLLFNTALLVLSLAFAWGVATSFLILVVVGLLTLFARWGGRPKIDSEATGRVPDLLCLLISGIGATLWCADALSPVMIDGPETVFKLWHDSFAHMRIISAFAQSHGLGTVSDLRMAGAPPFLYHYASYFTPAAVVSLTGASAFEAFAGFQLPFGVLLAGLAAFALAASLWGSWPGLAASCALILLPDAYQQGFGNRYLSYNFLQQVNLAGLYGVSCAAAAWIFILNGCKSGGYRSIIVGYALIMLTGVYKSQIFVANAFLAMIYPCLFFKGLRPSRRGLVAVAFVVLFGIAVWLSQRVGGVPRLQPDLSFRSAAMYASIVLKSYNSGIFKSLFSWLILPDRPRAIVGLSIAAMILLSSLGLWSVAFGMIFVHIRKRTKPAVLFFPLFLIANYLVMALGLSLNTGSIGAADELQNRPVVWAYFGVVSWTAGAAYACAFGNRTPRGQAIRVCAATLVLSSFVIPWRFGRDLQTFPAWRGSAGLEQFASFPSSPSCLVRAAQYIRQHSQSGDVIQDSENDPHILVGALAERQEFADDWIFGKGLGGLKERISDLGSFKATANEADLVAFAKKNEIRWYLLHPESKVHWPEYFLEKSVFDCDGYRVYRFPI
jgi:hypothetical protein